MQNAIERFLQYLRVERNASDLTIKSYREDLAGLVAYLTETGAPCPAPASITTLDLRGYVASLHEAAYAKTTIARRLASLRSFFRFGQREGWSSSNPAKPLRNPRKPRDLPHFLSSDDLNRLLETPPGNQPFGLRDRAMIVKALRAQVCLARKVFVIHRLLVDIEGSGNVWALNLEQQVALLHLSIELGLDIDHAATRERDHWNLTRDVGKY